MGLTKQYLRYASAGLFNIVASQKCCVELLELKGVRGKYCAVGACEHVIIWDLRKGEQVSVIIIFILVAKVLSQAADDNKSPLRNICGTLKNGA